MDIIKKVAKLEVRTTGKYAMLKDNVLREYGLHTPNGSDSSAPAGNRGSENSSLSLGIGDGVGSDEVPAGAGAAAGEASDGSVGGGGSTSSGGGGSGAKPKRRDILKDEELPRRWEWQSLPRIAEQKRIGRKTKAAIVMVFERRAEEWAKRFPGDGKDDEVTAFCERFGIKHTQMRFQVVGLRSALTPTPRAGQLPHPPFWSSHKHVPLSHAAARAATPGSTSADSSAPNGSAAAATPAPLPPRAWLQGGTQGGSSASASAAKGAAALLAAVRAAAAEGSEPITDKEGASDYGGGSDDNGGGGDGGSDGDSDGGSDSSLGTAAVSPPTPPALPGPLAPPELFSGDVGLPDGGQVRVTDGHVELPEGMTHLPNGAFRNCAALLSVSCPKTLRVIGSYAFYGCTSLARADFNDGLTSIGKRAFMNTKSLNASPCPHATASLALRPSQLRTFVDRT